MRRIPALHNQRSRVWCMSNIVRSCAKLEGVKDCPALTRKLRCGQGALLGLLQFHLELNERRTNPRPESDYHITENMLAFHSRDEA
jgi:hypothetical protein